MIRAIRTLLPFWLAILIGQEAGSQTNTYILNGFATQNSCNCYTLTQPVVAENGSVWNASKIDLTQPFDYVFNVFLGCLDQNGADGIVFMLQPISTSIGTAGEGMGFQGVSPSIGISLDTWQNLNLNDPPYDHISIQANGVVAHGNDLAGPVPASPVSDNIEDCQWHLFRISWDPATFTLKAYFDGSLRVQSQVDLVTTIFHNDPLVYWGFSAATGGAFNLQRFCTALNPLFTTGTPAEGVCYGQPLHFLNQSQSFAPIKSYFWDFGDGTTSTLPNPPAHLYPRPDVYQVKLAITGLDGCQSDTLFKTVRIGDKPVPAFLVSDTCAGKPPGIQDLSTVQVGQVNTWQWVLDGTSVSQAASPSLTGLPAGPHTLQLQVATDLGCLSDTATRSFRLRPVPVVDFQPVNGCINEPLLLAGQQKDQQTTISQWTWQWDGGGMALGQQVSPTFPSTGIKSPVLVATATNGCQSEAVSKPVFINQVHVNAGRDTIVVKNTPFQLHGTVDQAGSAPVAWDWIPGTGLNNPGQADPTGQLQDDQTYTLQVTTGEGCQARDSMTVVVFKGSGVYVPSGFTPNGDGRNDLLRPYLIAIRQLEYFVVYNRWGQVVYRTQDPGAGWDGTLQGTPQPSGTYVWVLKAIDVVGNQYQQRGTVTLIR
ncbi:MAG TPA: PKD domain-containing protein [Chitinophagaceae bacterium]|nr:PKD domain-containing protein [Chitinophagaceae bacterium]